MDGKAASTAVQPQGLDQHREAPDMVAVHVGEQQGIDVIGTHSLADEGVAHAIPTIDE
jgi:hypothetical protein